MIYFDNAATTAVNKEILDKFVSLSQIYFANPSSPHLLGQETEHLLEKARKDTLRLLGVPNNKLIFTSGATEGNNAFLKGAFLNYKNRGNKIVTSQGEHPSVRATLMQLKELYGAEIVEIPLLENGKVDKEVLFNAIDDKTIICSLIAVNNETGAVNDIEEIARFLKKYPKCLFHVDATQAIGKVPINYKDVDAFTFSLHKINGLKGSGCLVLKSHIELVSLLSGGKQEMTMRAGTVNLVADLLVPDTLELALGNYNRNIAKIRDNHAKLMSFLQNYDEIIVNSPLNGSPFIINFSLKNKKASVIVEALALKGITVGTTSACSTRLGNYSHVINAKTNDKKRSEESIRLSFCYDNTDEEVDTFIQTLQEVISEVMYG